jgi:hypothetical protein
MSGAFQGTEKVRPGQTPFGKASLANTFLGLGRFISMRNKSSWAGEGWYCNPSGAWPDEALERGLPRPLAKSEKN